MSITAIEAPMPAGPCVRRLSSIDAKRECIPFGPTGIVSTEQTVAPSVTSQPSSASEIASSIEQARHHLESIAASPSPEPIPSATTVTPDYAFAFDIDGVLLRGGRPLPSAIEAFKVLNGDNPRGIKVPYIFLTNGGGKTEAERCVQLSGQLGVEVSPGQFICGHSPMREMAGRYETVLVVGGEGEKCRQVAEGYGFKNVVTPGDIIKSNSATTPFRSLTPSELEHSRPLPPSTVISAIFVFADSRDWASDQQIILDLLMSRNGQLDTLAAPNFDQGPPVYFSHNDILWSAAHEQSRLGMGALRVSLAAMFKAVTGRDLPVHSTTAFGKPQRGTFEFASRVLAEWRRETHGLTDGPPGTVYFVGDTPESDIRGANEFAANTDEDVDWYSVLVKTGVYQDGTAPSVQPRAIVEDVLEAVRFGMEREERRAEAKAGNGERNHSEVV